MVDTICCDFSPTLVSAADVKQISSFEEKRIIGFSKCFPFSYFSDPFFLSTSYTEGKD